MKQATNRLEGSFVFAKVVTSDIKIGFRTTSDCPRRAPRLFTRSSETLRKKKIQIFFWQPNEIPSIKVTQKQNVHKILACDLALLWGIRTISAFKGRLNSSSAL